MASPPAAWCSWAAAVEKEPSAAKSAAKSADTTLAAWAREFRKGVLELDMERVSSGPSACA
ncbi:MAG: hypothetical protein OHK0013_30130 [Sandaracinaceae bacterium]